MTHWPAAADRSARDCICARTVFVGIIPVMISIMILAVSAVHAAGETPAERIAQILEDGAYQSELPGQPAAPEIPDVTGHPSVEEQADTAPPPTVAFETAPSTAPTETSMLSPLLWTLAAAAAVLLAAFLVSQFLAHRAGRQPPGEEPADHGREPLSGARGPVGPLADADQLAQSGAWAEAIHLLLLHGVEDLRRRLNQPVPPALTSRELLARIKLPDRAASALSAIVAAVERSYFGGKPVGQDDYQACREHYRAFLDHARATGA